jgi:hypothetical protein
VAAFVSDVTVIGDVAPDSRPVAPPSLDAHVAVKPVIVLPPVPFAVNATMAELLPRVTPVTVGAGAVVAATNDADAAEAALSPIALVATTAHVYVLVLVSAATVIGELTPDAGWVVPPSLETHVAV